MKIRRTTLCTGARACAVAAMSAMLIPAAAFAQGKPPGAGGGGGGGGGGGEVELAGNNLSFPVILSDNVAPTLPADAPWKFADITNPQEQCVGEDGVPVGSKVPPEVLCYYGRQVKVVPETGEVVFLGEPKVWWLQKRPQNFWKSLVVGRSTAEPLTVSAVDVGDLLESSPTIATRQIRTEFSLMQQVSPDDAEFGQFVVKAWNDPAPLPCQIPTTGSTSFGLGCFAAIGMSGAVPGTEQSINEMQGGDFGPDTTFGTRTLLNPQTVKTTTAGGIDALVYSHCARLVIQRLIGPGSTWDPAMGQWTNASAPIANLAAYRGEYKSEVTSSGNIVYGYNWNAKSVATGTYRITFVLDGNDNVGPHCTTKLATQFTRGGTNLVNVGENRASTIVFAGEGGLGDEGGLVFIDVPISTKGGGGRGGKSQ